MTYEPRVPARIRWRIPTALASLATLALLPAAATGAAPGPAPAKASPQLAKLAAKAPQKRLEVLVQLQPGVSTTTGRALLAAENGRVLGRDLPIINGFGAKLPAGDALDLAARPQVKAVSLNGGARVADTTATEQAGEVSTEPASGTNGGCPATTDTAAPALDVPLASRDNWATAAYLKSAWPHSIRAASNWNETTGKGVGVAVLDTGIAGDMVDFRAAANARTSRVVASAVVNPCANDGRDGYGHGTHVAGLIAGNGTNYPVGHPLYGRYMGVAPDANLISVKVADEDGGTSVLDVLYGIQFVVDHKDAYGIRVLNMSLSSTTAESYKTDPLDAAVEAAWSAGIVVVAAAGNEGAASDAVSYAPGNDPFIITVGGVDDRTTRTYADDVLAPWSSRGVTQDGVAKPEILAPGTRMQSTLSRGSDFAAACPQCVVDGTYFQVGGTSMATALVSGAVALMLEERPTLTPDQVKWMLVKTANPLQSGGAELDVQDALDIPRPLLSSLVSTLERNTTLLDPVTGVVDWTRASWRGASWRSADGTAADAGWSGASWRCDCSLTPSGAVDSLRASWRGASWRRTAEFDK
jgi:serine protease AprX